MSGREIDRRVYPTTSKKNLAKGWKLTYARCCKECDKLRFSSKNYNISPEDYTKKRAQSCGICGTYKMPAGRGGGMHIDHDHKTGQLRGTLCDRCNRGLGMFDDDPEKLTAAISYILRYRREQEEKESVS